MVNAVELVTLEKKMACLYTDASFMEMRATASMTRTIFFTIFGICLLGSAPIVLTAFVSLVLIARFHSSYNDLQIARNLKKIALNSTHYYKTTPHGATFSESKVTDALSKGTIWAKFTHGSKIEQLALQTCLCPSNPPAPALQT